MSYCKCGNELINHRRGDIITGICLICRQDIYSYCGVCRSYAIEDDKGKCIICFPKSDSSIESAAFHKTSAKFYDGDCPCGIPAAQCTYHAAQAVKVVMKDGEIVKG